MSNDVPLTGRWVADSGSARSAALAFIGFTLRRRAWWTFGGVVEVISAGFVAVLIESKFSWPTRIVWGLIYGLAPTLMVMAVVLLITLLSARHRFSKSLGEGVVLEAGVGADSLRLRGANSEHLIQFSGLDFVVIQGAWIVVRPTGAAVVRLWPVEVFAVGDIERLVSQTAHH